MKKAIFKVLSITLLIGFASGCLPRGESLSLDQILADAKSRYESVAQTEVKPEISEKIKVITTALDQLSTDVTSDSIKLSNEIADAITDLTPYAGTTNRPALYELSLQLKTVAEKKQTMPLNERKLISSRVFGALAAELETVKFGFA